MIIVVPLFDIVLKDLPRLVVYIVISVTGCVISQQMFVLLFSGLVTWHVSCLLFTMRR